MSLLQVKLAPSREGRGTAWLPLVAPLLAAVATIIVRVAGRYVQITPLADHLALATLLAAAAILRR